MRGAFVVFVVLAVVLAGCGGGGEGAEQTTAAAPAGETPGHTVGTETSGARDRARREGPAAGQASLAHPSGGPDAEPEPEVSNRPPSAPGGEDPREVGRSACAGMTPGQAAKRFELVARRSGVGKQFAAYVADPPPTVETSPGYPRLVAAVYAATLPAPQRADAAAGCAEELASPVKERGSSDRAMRQVPSSMGGNQEKGNNKE